MHNAQIDSDYLIALFFFCLIVVDLKKFQILFIFLDFFIVFFSIMYGTKFINFNHLFILHFIDKKYKNVL